MKSRKGGAGSVKEDSDLEWGSQKDLIGDVIFFFFFTILMAGFFCSDRRNLTKEPVFSFRN